MTNRSSRDLAGYVLIGALLAGCGPFPSDRTATAGTISTGTAAVIATSEAAATGAAEARATATGQVDQWSTQRANNLATRQAETTATASAAMDLPGVPAGWTLNVYDPFDSRDGRNWIQAFGSDNEVTRTYIAVERGRYIWEAEAKRGFVWWSIPHYESVQELTDFFVLVDARITGGEPASKYGLVFRCEDNRNLYLYEVTSQGYFYIYKLKNDAWENITAQRSTAILPFDGVNRLAVLGAGDQFQFYINTMLVYSMKDVSFDKGGVGVVIDIPDAGPKTVIDFDNFTVLTP